MAAQDYKAEVTTLLEEWKSAREDENYDPTIHLTKCSEFIEKASEEFYKQDPDPFDNRHPGYSSPSISYGAILKYITKQDDFMDALLNTYLKHSQSTSCIPRFESATRCLLALLPGLDTLGIFTDNPDLLPTLYKWAKTDTMPLCIYSTGILAFSVEQQDLISDHYDANTELVPIMLQRLWNLIQPGKFPKGCSDTKHTTNQPTTSQKESKTDQDKTEDSMKVSLHKKRRKSSLEISKKSKFRRIDNRSKTEPPGPNTKPEENQVSSFSAVLSVGRKSSSNHHNSEIIESNPMPSELCDTDASNSSWVEMKPVVIGCSFDMTPPLSSNIQERIMLDFLQPLGEYQSLLSVFLKFDILSLIKHYLIKSSTNDGQVTFSALRFFASLLCHNKMVTGFIENHGIQRLLSVRRPSRGATGVSLCLYYLAYNHDAMERVFQLSNKVLKDLVKYATWLLECSHDSGRCHAALFFSLTLDFPEMLRHFDNNDGLRYLLNSVSTLQLNRPDNNASSVMVDNDLYSRRLAARNSCNTMKKYLETHLTLKVAKVKAILSRKAGNALPSPECTNKVIEGGHNLVLENLDFLLNLKEPNPATAAVMISNWPEVLNFIDLDGVQLLIQVIGFTSEWSGYTSRVDTVKSALDCLAVATLMPKARKQLCKNFSMPYSEQSITGIGVILGVAVGEASILGPEPEAQKSALNVIINCVCGPQYKFDGAVGKVVNGTPQTKMVAKSLDETQIQLWEAVKTNNGIKNLLQLLTITQPSNHADVIRMLACKALCGLTRCESVKQIISKLPNFNNGQIQLLTRTPIMQGLSKQHSRFCKYMEELTTRVSGKPSSAHMDMKSIQKAHIVSQTVIRFDNHELLQLIHDHLSWSGLHTTAAALAHEASLIIPSTPTSGSLQTPKNICLNGVTESGDAPLSTPKKISFSKGTHASGETPTIPHFPPLLHTPNQKKVNIRFRGHANSGDAAPSFIPRNHLSRSGRVTVVQPGMLDILQETERRSSSRLPSLSTIVADYLKNQHLECKNPVVTVPSFSLLKKHHCPEPQFRAEAPLNLASRCMRRQTAPRFGGIGGSICDRQFIYSRFCPSVTIRCDDEENQPYTCCAFMPDDLEMILGNYQGDLCFRRLDNDDIRTVEGCCRTAIIRAEPRRDAKSILLIDDSNWGSGCALYSLDTLDKRITFTGADYAEFSKKQDRVLGTKESAAVVFDVETGQQTQTYDRSDMSNQYVYNRATFSYDDELILSDGLLWDVRMSGGKKPIHKFDKFSNYVSGVFHPQGLEAIINTEVWDLRNYHLLHTVSALSDCTIHFNREGTVLYGAQTYSHLNLEQSQMEGDLTFSKTFQTIDAHSYNTISVTDTKHQIADFAVDTKEFNIAVVERQIEDNNFDHGSVSVCRLYEIGRVPGDDQEEDEEDLVEDDDDDDDDDFGDLADDDVEGDAEFDEEDEFSSSSSYLNSLTTNSSAFDGENWLSGSDLDDISLGGGSDGSW